MEDLMGRTLIRLLVVLMLPLLAVSLTVGCSDDKCCMPEKENGKTDKNGDTETAKVDYKCSTPDCDKHKEVAKGDPKPSC